MKLRILILFLIPGLLSAQEFVPGSRLVQLVPGASGNDLTIPESVIAELVSAELNVWELHFTSEVDAERWDFESSSGKIIHYQKNHKLVKRGAPNDPDYNLQWQHKATPSNSPISGASLKGDVGSEEAWNRTTGGKLPGTTHDLVVCILDDGIDEDHPDLLQNLWFNSNEIPDNGIDDDGNGYVDDRMGWNIYSNDDDIRSGAGLFGGHGTMVAGMAGARGNNAEGISGVSQRVKLMIVKAEGDESDAIAGYSYPLAMRRLFNESLGMQGAFVVATNASWGVDFGRPADAPIWCSLYDSLGAAGILNTAATANNNTDVDVQGDLPTSCTSDFLISVTNNNALGDKVTFAGYGAQSIDLSAPGEDVYTTKRNGTYGTDSGTSFASPMVAGAVALLYSNLCDELIQLLVSEPETVAGYVKQAILDGAKPQSNQAGLTRTSGSLYLPDALTRLDEICGMPTAVEEAQHTEERVLVYPNPFSSKVWISHSESGFFSVVNALGTACATGIFSGEGVTQVDLAALPAGWYVLYLSEKNETRKMILLKE